VIYEGILGKILEFLGPKCGRPATLRGRLAGPRAQIGSVFSCWNHSVVSLMFTYIKRSNSVGKD
jgi:hypothetical protein